MPVHRFQGRGFEPGRGLFLLPAVRAGCAGDRPDKKLFPSPAFRVRRPNHWARGRTRASAAVRCPKLRLAALPVAGGSEGVRDRGPCTAAGKPIDPGLRAWDVCIQSVEYITPMCRVVSGNCGEVHGGIAGRCGLAMGRDCSTSCPKATYRPSLA